MYGIFNGRKLTRFTNAKDLNSFARIYVKWVLKQDGLETKLTKENITKYLDGWVEWSQDMEHPFESTDEAIDEAHNTLVWSNIHFMKGNTEVSSKDKEVISRNVYDILSI